jgi:hypothetical protein
MKKIFSITIFLIFLISAINITNASILSFEDLNSNIQKNEDYEEGEVIVGFNEKQLIAKSTSIVKTYGAKSILENVATLNAALVEVEKGKERDFIDAITKDPKVKYAELNEYMYALDKIPNDPNWDEQWGPKAINCEIAWEENGIGNKDVLIAIVDSGIDKNHEDLKGNYVALGYDWVNNDDEPNDGKGHGTHCAGIAAAVMDNNKGIAGVAQVSIMAERVLDNFGRGKYDNIAKGIIHATDAGADIISMSLGNYGSSNVVEDACQYAWENNVLIIGSSGNDGSSIKFPARLDTVMAVGAVDSRIRTTSWSNYGPELEIVAPGDKILSTYPGNRYKHLSGTSMAAPHVAGVAALIKSMGYNSNSEIREKLKQKAIDLGPVGWDEKNGYGLVDASLKGFGPGGENPFYLIVKQVKELDPIDVWPDEDPEWYYEINVKSDDAELTQYNFNLNNVPQTIMDSTYWENEWLSEDSWILNSVHAFKLSNDGYVTLEIALKDEDVIFHDTADISSDPERKKLNLRYDTTNHIIIEEESDIFYLDENGWLVADGESDGNEGDEDDARIWFIFANNGLHPPEIKNINVQGDLIDETIKFSANIQGGVRPYRYFWDLGDGEYSSAKTPSNTYRKAGSYPITLTVVDSNNVISDTYGIVIKILDTNIPEIVDFEGERQTKPNEIAEFRVLALDPHELKLQYGWDWNGDQEIDEWTEFIDHNEYCNIDHIWDEEGEYTVNVKARNENGIESEFESMSVSVPIHRIIFNNVFYWMLKIINSKLISLIYK